MQGNGAGAKPRPVLCAGQGCNAAGRCERFVIRAQAAAYASYDIERLQAIERAEQHGDTGDKVRARLCPAFLEVRIAIHRRARRAAN